MSNLFHVIHYVTINIETSYNWQTSDILLLFFFFKLGLKSSSATLILRRNLSCSFRNMFNITSGQIERNVAYQDRRNVIRSHSFAFKNSKI